MSNFILFGEYFVVGKNQEKLSGYFMAKVMEKM